MKPAEVPDYGGAEPARQWKLRLFVTDETPLCIAAYRNLKRICREHIEDQCDIEVVDVLENPEVARRAQIIAIPTLFKMSPEPQRVLVGDFSKVDRVLKGLDVQRAAGG